MEAYLNLLKKVSSEGNPRSDRTGTGTLSIFGEQIKIDLSKGFPLLTTKKVHFKSIVHELIWFLKGSTNIKYLVENNVSIWNEWADQNGELGNIYGKQWIDWNGTNQIQGVIDSIKNNPLGRRHIVSAWNVSELKTMALPPCHVLFQFYVSENKLSCQLYQRSADMFLGVPFNIASYALLTHMVAQCTNLGVGNLVISFGDLHLYLNHVEQAKIQLERSPLELPILELNKNITNIFEFTYNDIKLINYNSHQTIKAPIAI